MDGMSLIKGGLWLMLAGAAFVMAAIALVIFLGMLGVLSTLM